MKPRSAGQIHVMREPMDEKALVLFANEARTFVSWARGEDGVAMDVRSALLRILALYQAALFLPHPWTEGMNSELAQADLSENELASVQHRASQLPCQSYLEIFDPYENPAEPVMGHLTDDIGDIYRDIARGLILFNRGQHDEALWEWGYNLQIHWGEHATGAIRALHAHLVQENPDALASHA